jgi:hypothetical protein
VPPAGVRRAELLDRFPLTDNEDTRIENGIADFCFPSGLKLARSMQMPKFFCFVLTNAEVGCEDDDTDNDDDDDEEEEEDDDDDDDDDDFFTPSPPALPPPTVAAAGGPHVRQLPDDLRGAAGVGGGSVP